MDKKNILLFSILLIFHLALSQDTNFEIDEINFDGKTINASLKHNGEEYEYVKFYADGQYVADFQKDQSKWILFTDNLPSNFQGHFAIRAKKQNGLITTGGTLTKTGTYAPFYSDPRVKTSVNVKPEIKVMKTCKPSTVSNVTHKCVYSITKKKRLPVYTYTIKSTNFEALTTTTTTESPQIIRERMVAQFEWKNELENRRKTQEKLELEAVRKSELVINEAKAQFEKLEEGRNKLELEAKQRKIQLEVEWKTNFENQWKNEIENRRKIQTELELQRIQELKNKTEVLKEKLAAQFENEWKNELENRRKMQKKLELEAVQEIVRKSELAMNKTNAQFEKKLEERRNKFELEAQQRKTQLELEWKTNFEKQWQNELQNRRKIQTELELKIIQEVKNETEVQMKAQLENEWKIELENRRKDHDKTELQNKLKLEADWKENFENQWKLELEKRRKTLEQEFEQKTQKYEKELETKLRSELEEEYRTKTDCEVLSN